MRIDPAPNAGSGNLRKGIIAGARSPGKASRDPDGAAAFFVTYECVQTIPPSSRRRFRDIWAARGEMSWTVARAPKSGVEPDMDARAASARKG